jgi:predicted DCC family thiol-disulfide oxidoreductase YuxK
VDSAAPRLTKPLLVYDGTCGFCKRWIARWREAVGDRAEFAASQEAGARVPRIEPSAFAEAVHLVEPDGTISRGAEAVFRLLALRPGRGLGLFAYRSLPGFRPVSEACYRLVAGHRPFFDRATTWLWGFDVVPPGTSLTVSVYRRLLGVVFAVAFGSLLPQLSGLVGSQGILPVSETLRSIASDPALGPNRFWILPTLCWISSSNAFVLGLAIMGLLVSVALALEIWTVPCLIALWALYLSLAAVCREFLWFQWDGLLLEAAFLGMFLVPRGESSRGAVRSTRWLLFRLLVASAAVKLTSGDSSWRDLTALRYHYETQPLPTPVAWYFHQLPLAVHRVSAGITFLVEGLVPVLIFAPRRARFLAAGVIVAHQLLIALTGNYGFFNLLTIVLCVPLLDDGVWPRRWREGRKAGGGGGWPVWLRRPALVGVFLLSLVPLVGAFGTPLSWLGPLPAAYQLFTPFRTVNQYGLFAVMTKERPEIRIEGSRDGVSWKTYEFEYKAGDPARAPRFVAPYQPRLDWQMWFAALSDYRSEGWLLRFCEELLRGSRPVLSLLRVNPFPEGPPRYVRAMVDRYRFTDAPTRRATGDWWRREPVGPYAPVLTLTDGKLAAAPAELQRW